MKNDPCDIATTFADRLMQAKSNDELAFIVVEIQIDLMDIEGLKEWRDWLLTVLDTAWHNVNDKVKPIEKVLNKEGLNAKPE